MIAGVQPDPVRDLAPRKAAPAPSGNSLPVRGSDPPAQPAAAPPPPDMSRSIEVLDRYLADSQRTLQFRRDADAGRTIILVVDPTTGEVLRQIPAKERLALARWIAESRPPLVDLRA